MHPSSAGSTPRRVAKWLLILLFGSVSLALAVAGYRYYREQEQTIRAESYKDLTAIAELKVGQIVQWRQERLADARLDASGSIRTLFLQWSAAPAGTPLPADLWERTRSYAELEGYQNIILADPDGRVLLTIDTRLTGLEPPTLGLAAQAIATGQPVFGDFLLCPVCGEIHLDVAAPIVDENHRPVAVLILRTHPETYLYPLVQSWPMPSQSAETLLVRREGDDVLFLNALRHSSAPPLTLRIPLSRAEVPAVQAAHGLTGEFEGRDYREVEVLAVLHAVPGTSWFMIAKVDRAEILAEVRYRGQVVLTLVVLAILMAGIAAVGIYLYRQQRLYQRLFRAEQAQRQAREEIRTTLYSIGDGVIATDAAGRVTRMNPMAEALTGWREADAAGRPLAQVFRIVNEETHVEVENPVARVLREGEVVGLANHTLLIARDGTERPIADSGAAIRDERGAITGVVLVFRDQTEERAAQTALQHASARWQTTFDAMLDPVALIMPDGTIVQCNQAFAAFVGMEAQAVVGIKCHRLIHHTADHIPGCPLVRGRASKARETMELEFGAQTFLVVTDPIKAPDGQVIGFVHIMRDITEHKEAEKALRQSEQKFSRLFEKSAFAVSLSRLPDGILVDVNEAFERAFGYTKQEAVGKTTLELGINPDAEGRARILAALDECGSARDQELTLRTKSGAERIFSVNVDLVEIGDQKYILNTTQDITARRRQEAQLAAQLDELRRWHAVTLDRETRILDLKREVNELLAQLGLASRYPSADPKGP